LKEKADRKKQNEELEQLKKSDARTYWTKLKAILGSEKGEPESSARTSD